MHFPQKGLALLAVGCLSATVAVGNPPVEVTKKGSLRIDGDLFQVVCYNEAWQSFTQESGAFHLTSSSGSAADFKLEGEFRLGKTAPGALRATLRKTAENRYSYRADVKFAAPVKLSTLSLTAALPIDKFCGRTVFADGNQKIMLPVDHKPGTTHAVYRDDVTEVQIPGQAYKITFRSKTKFEFSIQDDRAFNGKSYTVRLLFTPPRGEISDASLQLEIGLEAYKTTPLDLSGAANAGFVDETDGDRKGGWTDQGAENDLRMLPTGRILLNGVQFEILDPAKNNGKSCIMLAAPARSYFAKRAEAVQSRPAQGKVLYLLHALAWPSDRKEIGRVTVNYTDGTRSEIPVTSGVDVGNWWAPVGLENGEVAWTGENKSAYVGLYRSNYPIENKPIRSLVFDTANRSVWGVVAASVSDDPVPLQRSAPFYIVEGKDWKPVPYYKDFEKGSALDFSGMLDAPAGKYGPVVNRNGKFVFRDRPEKPVRFYGINFCSTAQFLSKEWAERLADRMAATGYNAVRFHHHDGALSLRKDGRSTALHAARLDQLDYLMSCMSKRGIYYTTDLYVSRPLEKGELPEFPDRAIRQQEFKALVPVLDSAMENWKTFAKNWLTHVNPYTGFALKDDPALISISLINENVPRTCWDTEPYIAELYLKRFEEWKKENPAIANDPKLDREQQFSLFLTDNYDRSFREMKRFLREEVGVDKMLTDMNHQPQVMLQFSRNQYDYVDNHYYHEHPNFPVTPWRLPSTCANRSALASTGNPPNRMFATRIFGKPMMISEFDTARPNVFRSESPALAGAYASLQDWDALFQFAYSHSASNVMENKAGGGHFDTSTDLVKSLAQRIGIRLFLDREIKPAPLSFSVALTDPRGMLVSEEFSTDVMRLGLIARTGSMILPDGKSAPAETPADLKGFINVGPNSPAAVGDYPVYSGAQKSPLLQDLLKAGVLKPEWYDAEHGVYTSATGQISLDSMKQTFRAVAPSCEVLILPEQLSGEGKILKVDNRVGRGVFSAMSIDGKPLRESNRILFLHLTDSQSNKSKFTTPAMTQMEQFGELPILARRGEADVTLRTPAEGEYTLYSIDSAGKRLAKIPLARGRESGTLFFTAKVFTEQGPVFAYELVRR